MKVYPEKLQATLSKNQTHGFIVSGDEPLLVEESADLIRTSLRHDGVSEREVFHAEAGFDWTSLLESGNSMSLFAERKLLEVRIPNGKPGDQGGKTLSALSEQLSDDLKLLLILPRLDQSAQRTKWFKTIESTMAFVQVWPIDARSFPRWLDTRFKQAGLKADREAIRAMAMKTEGNLLAAIQEIERLKLLSTSGQVTFDDVLEGVADSARYDVFKLIDAALIGDINRATRMVDGLKAEGVEALYLVNMLARELRSLDMMKRAMNAGVSEREMFKKARVWDKRAPAVTRCLERHDRETLERCQLLLGGVDRMVKGIVQGDPWRELGRIVLLLAGEDILPAANQAS